jgi:hypothetical protein
MVHDPLLRYADHVIYAKPSAPDAVTWDRVIGPAIAPPGSYNVTVEACDIYGLCSQDTGTVLIPVTLTPVPLQLPVIEIPTWIPPIPFLSAPEQPIAVPAVVVPIQEIVPVVSSFPLWTMIVVSALLLSFALLLMLDPRPKAWRSLTQRIAESLITNH